MNYIQRDKSDFVAICLQRDRRSDGSGEQSFLITTWQMDYDLQSFLITTWQMDYNFMCFHSLRMTKPDFKVHKVMMLLPAGSFSDTSVGNTIWPFIRIQFLFALFYMPSKRSFQPVNLHASNFQ